MPIDYLGFDIPDVWVVGYGLDFAERYPHAAEDLRDAAAWVASVQPGRPRINRTG